MLDSKVRDWLKNSKEMTVYRYIATNQYYIVNFQQLSCNIQNILALSEEKFNVYVCFLPAVSCCRGGLGRQRQRRHGRRSQRPIPHHDIPAASAAGWPRQRPSGRQFLLRLLLAQLIFAELLALLTGLWPARPGFRFPGLQSASLFLPWRQSGGHVGRLRYCG